jgi:diguanylate cyclase (GGDEF)-like protein
MKKIFHFFNKRIFGILIIVEILFLLFVSLNNHEHVSFDNEPLFTFNKNWVQILHNGEKRNITLPNILETDESNTIILRNILPNRIYKTPTLIIKTSHQRIKAFIDKQLIYSTWITENHPPIDIPSKTVWHIIKLPYDASGRSITLKITADTEDYAGDISDVYIGTKASLLLYVVKTNGIGLLISSFILFIGFVLLVLYITLKNSLNTNKAILYLGRFCIVSALWMIMESGMMQFFMDNQSLISSITYISLMTLPIPLLQYITSIEHFKYRKLSTRLSSVYYCYLFFMILMQFTNQYNFHDLLKFLHLFMFGIFAIVYLTLCLEYIRYKTDELKYITLASGVLFSFGILELIAYNLRLMKTGAILQFGFLIFVIIITWGSITKGIAILRLSEAAKQYEYLATFDFMTKCKNRTAYAKDIENFDLNDTSVFLIADINKLKFINDTYGHSVGDDAIKKCAKYLLKIFGRDGDCYRIGGDEFVWIGQNHKKETIDEMVNRFFAECELESKNCYYPFEVSIGYAFYDKNIDFNVQDTISRADQNMYVRKDIMKNQV